MIRKYIVPEDPGGYVLNPERSYFAVVFPEESVNLVVNPEVYDTFSYYAADASVSTSLYYRRRGIRSLRVVPSIVGGKAYHLFSGLLAAGEIYTFSVDVLGPATIKMYLGDENGARLGQSKSVSAPNFWNRFHITDTMPIGVRSIVLESTDGRSFYADGWQCERKPYPTTFISGNMETREDMMLPGTIAYGWMGQTHRSRSYRTSDVVDGGRPVSFSDLGLQVTDFSGFGHATKEIHLSPWAFSDGAAYTGETLTERQFTIGGWIVGNDIVDVLAMRGAMAGATAGPRCLHIQMYRGDRPTTEVAEVVCSYQSGLEGVHNNATREKVALTFRAWNPYLRLQGNQALYVPVKVEDPREGHATIMSPDGIASSFSLADETWMEPGWKINCIEISQNGDIYAGVGNRLVRLSPSGQVLEVITTVGSEVVDIVSAGGMLYFMYKHTVGQTYALVVLRRNLTTGAQSGLGSTGNLQMLNTGGGPEARMRHDKKRKRLYFAGKFDLVSFNSSQLQSTFGVAAQHLFYYDYQSNVAYSEFDAIEKVFGGDYTVRLYDVAIDKAGREWIVGDFKYGFELWLDPESNTNRQVPSAEKPWGMARWDKVSGKWVGGALTINAGHDYDIMGVGPRVLCFDGNQTIFAAGATNLRVWRYRQNWIWTPDAGYAHCPKSLVMIGTFADSMVFQVNDFGLYNFDEDDVIVHDMAMGDDGDMYVVGDFAGYAWPNDAYRASGDGELVMPAVAYHVSDPNHPLLVSKESRGVVLFDTKSDKPRQGIAHTPIPANRVAVSAASTPYSVYIPAEVPSTSEWEDSSEVIRLAPGTAMVAHDYGDTFDTPMAEMATMGDRFVARLELTGKMFVKRVDFPLSGKFLSLEMQVDAGETIVLSFAHGRPWIRSSTRGELEYPSLGTDSWPEVGLQRGPNRVIVRAEGASSSASAYLYWTPEHRSFDQIVVEATY